MQSTPEGHFLGATRRCVFTGGIAFDEKIVELDAGKRLTFDIISQPNHPEIVGHFDLGRGQFDLQDNGGGTTTVIGTSWYSLRVYPASCFDLWTQCIVRNVHMRVMRHIRDLIQAGGSPTSSTGCTLSSIL